MFLKIEMKDSRTYFLTFRIISLEIFLVPVVKTILFQFAFAFSLLVVVMAAPSVPQYGYSPPPPAYDDPPRYDFNYAVKDYSNNDFGHQENRDGYNTNGGYSVLLPDGRLQRVTYTVNGDEGYVAEVTYEGEAQYPAHQPATYHPTPAPYRPTPAPYRHTPAPYRPTPAPYHPTPAPYYPTPAPYH
ncbi:uncharacterized protein LOC143036239 [Oratosquilla oratoria]|uniref:uncharacterized protein LOC143036239 n=1 Tax=Oratosquilla oratoria TaxID=337810 RepID=UPI003F7665FC